jgi:hypothetical protein
MPWDRSAPVVARRQPAALNGQRAAEREYEYEYEV